MGFQTVDDALAQPPKFLPTGPLISSRSVFKFNHVAQRV